MARRLLHATEEVVDMKMKYTPVALSTGLAVGLALASSARAEPSSSQPADQARVAEVTLNLERAFSDQFVRGQIDRDALSSKIDDVVQAVPESARPTVKAHIDRIIAVGSQAALQMLPEARAEMAAPPAREKISSTAQAWLGGFGWGFPNVAGWGGLGAFAFPTMYGFGTGCGFGACGLGMGGLGWGMGGLGGWAW
jgi:hypothetical protein